MKVYIVTSGEYSDYGIEAVFTDPLQARLYTLLHAYCHVEEYEADSVFFDCEEKILRVVYCWWGLGSRCSKVIDAYVSGDAKKKSSIDERRFTFYTKIPQQLIADIKNNGKDSPLLKKIAEDEFAKYLYSHNMTAEALHEKYVRSEEQKRTREKARRLKEQERRRQVKPAQKKKLDALIDDSVLKIFFQGSPLSAHWNCPVLTVSGFNRDECKDMLSHAGLDRLDCFLQTVNKHSKQGCESIHAATSSQKVKTIKIGDGVAEITFTGEK